MVVATGDGGPDKRFNFSRYASHDPHHNLCLFEHVEGCRVCEEIYGHYLLPSGQLAHLCLLDKVVKGHRVDLVAPPEVPFSTHEWFEDGLPSCDALADPARHLFRTGDLTADLYCPVPELGPAVAPGSHILEWEAGKEGSVLQPRTVCLRAVVVVVTKEEVETTVVPPTVPKKKKR